MVSLADPCLEAAGWRAVDSLWHLAGSWERRAGERVEEDSGEPVSSSGWGWGETVQTPPWGIWEWGFASVLECSFPKASRSPSVGLCMLLSGSKCACGGASVAGDLCLTFPLTPSSITAVTPLPLPGILPRCPKSVPPGEGKGLEATVRGKDLNPLPCPSQKIFLSSTRA